MPPERDGRAPCARHRPSSPRASHTHRASERVRQHRRGLADRDDRCARVPVSASQQIAEVAALVTPADHDHQSRSTLSMDRRAGLDVGGLRVVHEAHAVDRRRPAASRAAARETRRRRAGNRLRRPRPPCGAIAVAASTSLRMWRPITCTADTGTIGSLTPPCRSTMCPASTVNPSAASSSRYARAGAPSPRAKRARRQVVGVDDRPVVGRLALEDARLGGGVRLDRSGADRDGRARSSAAPRSTGETCRSLSS